MGRPPAFYLLAIALLTPLAGTMRAAEFQFHDDHILGTSVDMTVCSPDQSAADRAHQAVLDEIERLRRILSTYDPQSEISRLNAAAGTMRCSPELIEVLSAYDTWAIRSGGAYSGRLGELIAAWKEAQRAQLMPNEAHLAGLVQQISLPAWQIDAAAGTIRRLTGQPLNVDSLGKGYIIGRAVAAARTQVPSTTGILLNIGGDMFAFGADASGWRIGVADPAHPEDNAPTLTTILLRDRAIATSAAYERGYTINGTHYSHILDPRTGRPATAASSATVIAADNVTANALATTLCVLGPDAGMKLVAETRDAEALIIAPDGRQFRSPGFRAFEADAPATNPAKQSNWPKDFQVSLTITLKQPSRRNNRPYVAIWIENAEHKAVRTLSVWGNERKYLRDLPSWWKVGSNQPALVRAVTRATRPAGRYRLAWDGTDDQGKLLPPGTYAFLVEVNSEHGAHARRSAELVCKMEPTTATIPSANDFENIPLIFGPRSEQP